MPMASLWAVFFFVGTLSVFVISGNAGSSKPCQRYSTTGEFAKFMKQ